MTAQQPDPAAVGRDKTRTQTVDGIAYIMPLCEPFAKIVRRVGPMGFLVYFRPQSWGIGFEILSAGLAIEFGPLMFAAVHVERFLGPREQATLQESPRTRGQSS